MQSSSSTSPVSGQGYNDWENEIRKKVEPIWATLIKASAKDHVSQIETFKKAVKESKLFKTRLLVTVSDQGKVLDVKIIESCGADYIDVAGVETFKKAETVPSPPASLIKDGKANLKWDFIVKP